MLVKTKHIAITLCILSILAGCRKETEDTKFVEVPTQNYYFDFDEAIYYSSTPVHTAQITFKENPSFKDSIVGHIIGGFQHNSLRDTMPLVYLDSMGYTKKVIPASKHAALREIFKPKSYHDDGTATDCYPTYRDIYVFKKDGKVSGMAKICYECRQHLLIGNKADDKGFGYNGEYKQLYDLVKK